MAQFVLLLTKPCLLCCSLRVAQHHDPDGDVPVFEHDPDLGNNPSVVRSRSCWFPFEVSSPQPTRRPPCPQWNGDPDYNGMGMKFFNEANIPFQDKEKKKVGYTKSVIVTNVSSNMGVLRLGLHEPAPRRRRVLLLRPRGDLCAQVPRYVPRF